MIGGDIVYDDVFPWTAETTPETRKAWSESLDAIAAKDPKIVVPGHQKSNLMQDPKNLEFTKQYLEAYDEALAASKTAKDLEARVKAQYPDTALDVILKLGSEASLPPGGKSATK